MTPVATGLVHYGGRRRFLDPVREVTLTDLTA